MKKAISLTLALALAMTMTAFAADINVDNNTIDVGASYTGGGVSVSGTVYSVKLTWTAIENISYDAGTTAYKWDAAQLKYVEDDTKSVDAGWNKGETSCTITVTNSSNAAVTATAAFSAKENIGATVSCEFTNNGVEVASAAPTEAQLAAGTTAGSVKTAQIGANISANGALNSGVTSVGTITITISGN